MTRLIIGTALGFMAAQALLYVLKRLLAAVASGELRYRLRGLVPSRGHVFLRGFIKYASLLGGSAALITFGVWSVEDYLAAKAARAAATLKVPDLSAPAPEPDVKSSTEDIAAVSPVAEAEESASAAEADPYTDPAFKVQRARHRAHATASLKETLVQRSEARARDDLLSETRQHMQRSQYDCEAADRASRYVKAGLDVWGFTAWQLKYFPVQGYKGARLTSCKDIKDLVDTSATALQPAVAQQTHP